MPAQLFELRFSKNPLDKLEDQQNLKHNTYCNL